MKMQESKLDVEPEAAKETKKEVKVSDIAIQKVSEDELKAMLP